MKMHLCESHLSNKKRVAMVLEHFAARRQQMLEARVHVYDLISVEESMETLKSSGAAIKNESSS